MKWLQQMHKRQSTKSNPIIRGNYQTTKIKNRERKRQRIHKTKK